MYYTDEQPAAPETAEIGYVNVEGETASAPSTLLNGSETTLDAGWYAVSGEVTVDGDITLNGDVNLILTDGAALTVNGGISGEGTITLGYAKETDFILAAKYEGSKVTVAEGKTLYIPDVPKDFSLVSLFDTISLVYNGEMQQPTKEDVLGKVWFEVPLYQGTYTTSTRLGEYTLGIAQNRMLCPYTGECDPYQNSILTPLSADDFDLGEVEAGKDVTVTEETGTPAKTYAVEIIGKGEYTGSRTNSWYMAPADVDADITVAPKSSLISDGTPVTAEDFEITTSTPLAQALVDEIASGKAQAPISFYSTEPLTGENITSECKAGIALEKGHVYDLNELGMYAVLMIAVGEGEENFTMVSPGKLNTTIYVIQDGERKNGCVEIDADGALCYYVVDPDGEDTYMKGEPDPNMYWHIEKGGSSPIMPIYYLNQDFMDAQKTDATEPGSYVARMVISETGSYHYSPVTKIVPFTIQKDEQSETTPTEEAEQIAPDETLLKWAAKDYQDKTGTKVTAFPVEKLDGTLAIALKDSEGNHIMSYEIDTKTGIGTDQDGKEVNLPQTGNNALTQLLVTVGAFLMMLAGGFAVVASGVHRRKRDENQ